MANPTSMRTTLFRLRRRARPDTATDQERARRAFDRSKLLAELEVSVPAPERIVHWEAARERIAASRR